MMSMTIIVLLILGTLFIIGLYLALCGGRRRDRAEASQRNCPACQAELRPGSEFCPRCGRQMHAP